MSPIRRLAVRILETVVRWASPGCREWAEGLAREVEFIGSDWDALGWAIGSLRVVLDRRQAPIGSDTKPARPGFQNVVFWLLYLEVCFSGCTKMLTSTGWQHRVGWGSCHWPGATGRPARSSIGFERGGSPQRPI